MNNRATRTALLCLLAISLQRTAATAADSRPNILLIVGDDMGYADIGIHGCKDIPTPNIDRLANSGTRCTNGYVSGPYCSPTRAGLLTGRYQTRFGHEFNPAGDAMENPAAKKKGKGKKANTVAADDEEKKTLADIKAARPGLPYETRYGAKTGAWTTDMFIEAVYKSLTAK